MSSHVEYDVDQQYQYIEFNMHKIATDKYATLDAEKQKIFDLLVNQYSSCPNNIQTLPLKNVNGDFNDKETPLNLKLCAIQKGDNNPFANDNCNCLLSASIADKYNFILNIGTKKELEEFVHANTLQWNENTRIVQIFKAKSSDELIPKNNIIGTQGLLKSSSEEGLRNIGIPKSHLDLVKSFSKIADLQKYAEYLPQEVFERLYDLIDSVNKNIGADFNIKEAYEAENGIQVSSFINNTNAVVSATNTLSDSNPYITTTSIVDSQLTGSSSTSSIDSTSFTSSEQSVGDIEKNVQNKLEQITNEINEGKKLTKGNEDNILDNANNKRYIHNFSFKVKSLEDFEKQFADKRKLGAWVLYLHEKQQVLVDKDYKGSFKVSGSAGTGKTVVALHRLKRLLEESQSNEKFLFTTYTKALVRNLQQVMLPALDIDCEDNPKLKVINIDALCSEIVRSFINSDDDCLLAPENQEIIKKISKNFSVSYTSSKKDSLEVWKKILSNSPYSGIYTAEFLLNEYNDVILYNNLQSEQEYFKQSRVGRGKVLSRRDRMNIWSLVSAYQDEMHQSNKVDRLEAFNIATKILKQNPIWQTQNGLLFDHVFVDEFQDMSTPELRFLRTLARKAKNDMFMVGDPFQQIYKRKMNFKDAGIHIRGTSRILKVNYRTTEEIKSCSVRVLEGLTFDDLNGSIANNAGYLSASLYNHNSNDNVVVPKYYFYTNDYGAKKQTEQVVNYIKNLHEKENIPYSQMCLGYFSDKSMDFNAVIEALKNNKIATHSLKLIGTKDVNKDCVLVSSFQNMKGLEFKVVILIGVNSYFDTLIANEEIEEQREDLRDASSNNVSISEKGRRLKSTLYVCMSRAQKHLAMFGSGNSKNEMFSLFNDIPKENLDIHVDEKLGV